MLVLFLAASTGLNFYIHICSCSHKTFTSIFEEHKCHATEVVTCCNASQDNEPNYSKSDCGCKSMHLSIKIDEIFNSSNQIAAEAKIFSFQIDKVQHPLLGLNNTNQVFISTNDLYTPDSSPPIKTAGRVLIYFLHQSKSFDHLS